GSFTDVGTECLNWHGISAVTEELEQCNCQGIDLFTARASRDPDANRLARLLVGHDLRKNPPLQHLEGFGLAEEAGDMDEDVLEKRFQFVAAGLELRQIFL